MKICLINNLFQPYERGGAETVASRIVDGLIDAGHEVFIVTTKPSGQNKPETSQYRIFRLNGFICASFYHLHKLTMPARMIWHIFNIFNFSSYRKIKKILQNEKPDLVLTHNLMGIGFLTPLAISSLKLKHYHTLHDIQLLHPSGLMNYGEEEKINSLVSRLYQKINRRLFDHCHKVFSPSDWLFHEHTEKNFFKNAKSQVLRNPAAFSNQNPTKHPHVTTRENKKFSFLFVGQLEQHKGVSYLIEAFNQLTNEAELTIIGSGKLMPEITALTKANNNIKFVGKLTNDEVKLAMSQADCLVVPSLCYENSPTVIYEAQSVGLPVLAASIGGIPELLNENDLLLFKPNNTAELTSKLTWATKHYTELKQHSNEAIISLGNQDFADYLNAILAP